MFNNFKKLVNKNFDTFSHSLLLFLLLIVILTNTYMPSKETFSVIHDPLRPGSFPDTIDKPLLKNDYPLKSILPGEGVSANESQDNYLLYPTFKARSCKTNNIRYWTTPDNGLCSRAEMCGTLYDKKHIKHQTIVPPKNNSGIRVNYYNSS